MERKDFEIMAPAGTWEALTAAIQGGANSVYFGVGALNMRARSANTFCVDDLKKIVQICRDHGVRSYLTLNSVIYDQDFELMNQLLTAAKEAQISAIIATDVAAMLECRRLGLEVHLSTQLNISNIEALKFYARFADVVVLARELNLTQVARIHDEIVKQKICGPNGSLIKLEMFCHGALCMAISGKCYLSLDSYAKSANRGACMQMCRRAYIVKDKERDVELEIDNQYIMSPKDLKTIGFIDKMMEAGVRVFKIEGRARGPEYVRTVVECYDAAIKTVLSGGWNEQISRSWDQKLATVYNRGFWDGHYLGQTMGEWSNRYGSQATERKVYAGKAVNYFGKVGVAEFLIQATSIRAGEKLLVTGPSTGAQYLQPEEFWVDEKIVDHVIKGQHLTIKVDFKVRENDKLYVIKQQETTQLEGKE